VARCLSRAPRSRSSFDTEKAHTHAWHRRQGPAAPPCRSRCQPLSDWLEIPNLQQRSRDLLAAWTRHLLWGGPRPEAEPRGRALLLYGVLSWLVSLAGVVLLVLALYATIGVYLGSG
jgi:hypothetical protein